jgi:hypothetical protein
MSDNLTQIGIGGIFALMVIREVLGFLKKKNPASGDNGHSGTMPVSFWREQFRQIISEVINNEFKTRDETIRRIIREEIGRQ